MSRTLCPQCHRPEKACICSFTVKTKNKIHVVILQHPTEVKQSKGTVSLLQQSLYNCQVIVGESFAENACLNTLLSRYGEKIALLYPSEDATVIEFIAIEDSVSSATEKLTDGNDIECIVILDGTWKKAYRMFMLNPFLHHMKHLVLPAGIVSLYNIRKTKKDNALSSLEACCHALARLENEQEKYQVLLNSFIKFNSFQQSFNQGNETSPKR